VIPYSMHYYVDGSVSHGSVISVPGIGTPVAITSLTNQTTPMSRQMDVDVQYTITAPENYMAETYTDILHFVLTAN